MNRFHLLSVFLTLSFCSCEPYSEYKMVLENRSTINLTITRIDSTIAGNPYFGHSNELEFSTMTNVIVGGDGSIGSTEPYEKCPVAYTTDSLRLINMNGESIILNIDINNPESWSYTFLEEGKYGGGDCECRIIVTDEMIQ